MSAKPAPDTPSCQHCRYFHAHDQHGHGDCHRFPPSFAGEASPNEKHHWKHPIVTLLEWCGEFAPRQAL